MYMKKKAVKTKSPKRNETFIDKQFDVKRVTQVTMLSRVFAAILFIALPFVAFMIGAMYQNVYNVLP